MALLDSTTIYHSSNWLYLTQVHSTVTQPDSSTLYTLALLDSSACTLPWLYLVLLDSTIHSNMALLHSNMALLDSTPLYRGSSGLGQAILQVFVFHQYFDMVPSHTSVYNALLIL